jgi:glucosamine-6-phosphate deaminase
MVIEDFLLEQQPKFFNQLQTMAIPAPVQTRAFRVAIFKEEQAVGGVAAAVLAEQARHKPDSVWLLPTGRTPLMMYSQLVKIIEQEEVNLARVRTFNLDEFYGISPEHPGSYHTYMRRALFDKAGIPAQNTHLLDGSNPDPRQECANYEAQIRAEGGIDLAVLGIGANGHIGFNEPGSELDSRTQLVEIRPETREANAFLFDQKLENVPGAALTAGIATIMEARRILLLATGGSKARAVAAMLNGPVTSQLPASFLRLHPNVTLLADRAAAELLG